MPEEIKTVLIELLHEFVYICFHFRQMPQYS
jgi:hypothetical protein